MLIPSRRSFLIGLTAIAAPSIVRASSLDILRGSLLDPWVLGRCYPNNPSYVSRSLYDPIWDRSFPNSIRNNLSLIERVKALNFITGNVYKYKLVRESELTDD